MTSLYVCLRFPYLPLDITLRGHPEAEQQVLAISEKQKILLATEPAERAGIQSGMNLSSAWALLPALKTVERQPPKEQRAMKHLANWAYQFTPAIQMGEHFTLILDIASSLRLFKGLDALLQQVEAGLQALGFRYCLGLASNPVAAELFSYSEQKSRPLTHEATRSALEQLPLTQLLLSDGLSKDLLQKLNSVGFSDLGVLLAMPKASVGKRFGKGFVRYLQRLSGELIEPSTQLKLAPCFDSERHFLSGLSTIDMVRLPMTELLQELQTFLIQRQLFCQGLRWRFFHFDKQASLLDIALSQPQQRWENFFKLTELKLSQLSLDSAIESIQLYSNHLFEAEPESHSLFKELSQNSTRDANFLVDKLLTRLGHERLYRLDLHDENLPELQQKKIKAEYKAAASAPTVQAKNTPLWLCEPPQALSVRREQLHYQGPMSLVSAAQRMDSHWWQQRQQRDYFVAQHQQGSHYWVYYDHRAERWFLHGIYA